MVEKAQQLYESPVDIKESHPSAPLFHSIANGLEVMGIDPDERDGKLQTPGG